VVFDVREDLIEVLLKGQMIQQGDPHDPRGMDYGFRNVGTDSPHDARSSLESSYNTAALKKKKTLA